MSFSTPQIFDFTHFMSPRAAKYFLYVKFDDHSRNTNLVLLCRVQSVRQAARSFLKKNECKCQIVNMGAGFDTLFWNLTQEGLQPLAFVELDFPQVVKSDSFCFWRI